jgi:hypothetical protein
MHVRNFGNQYRIPATGRPKFGSFLQPQSLGRAREIRQNGVLISLFGAFALATMKPVQWVSKADGNFLPGLMDAMSTCGAILMGVGGVTWKIGHSTLKKYGP